MARGGTEDVNRHHHVFRVAKRAELDSATRIRDGGKTGREAGLLGKCIGKSTTCVSD